MQCKPYVGGGIMKTLALAFVAIALLPGGAFSQPIEISTPDQLQAISANLAGNYILVNDIDLTGFPWVAIGHTGQNGFTGTFDGDYHIINGLTAADTDTEDSLYKNCSLFGVLGKGGVVKNVGLTNVNVSAGWYCAALVGDVYGEVTNCFAINGTVSVAGNCGNTGSLIGMTREGGSVSNCYSTLEFILPASSDWPGIHGGFIGHVSGPVTNCYYAGVITPTGDVSGGGFFGNGAGVLTSCYFDVEVGGIAGLDAAGSTTEGGRTTDEMMQQATYVDWDFAEVWSIDEGQDYPVLSMFLPPNPQAGGPSPKDGGIIDCPNAVLGWTPGEYADTHDVYFGVSFDEVNDATNLDPMGPDQVYRARQSAADYAIAETLEYGQTYYWRIDEVNAPPTAGTIYGGEVWQFTVAASYEIPGTSITATADSSDADQGPDKTIDGSGLDEADLHSTELTDMWVSAEAGVGDPWIKYEFDKEYKLDKLLVWNHNSPLESMIGIGIKGALIEYSTDGQTWQSLGGTVQFDRAPGTAGYGGGTPVDLGGIVAKYVKITAQSNWGGIVRAAGLSEVRFLYVPMRARTPDPADEAAGVAYDTTLSWSPGRDAVSHDVYLSTNREAFVDGSVTPISVAADDVCAAGYSPELVLNQTYYWRVNEFDGEKTWEGDVWRFSTEEYRVVDDMTSYGEVDEMGVPEGRAWFVWRDGEGWLTPEHPAKGGNGTGAVVDRYTPEDYETPQSLWYSYDNDGRNYFGTSNKKFYSEVTANISDLPIGGDWTAAGVKALSIHFYGDANNIATEQLYVKVNGAKVLYDGDMADIAEASWHQWNIDLSLLATDLTNVTQITIGFGDENNTVARDARGIVFFDDIRLYSSRCILANRDPAFARVDYVQDCAIDYRELEAMLQNWLAVAAPAGTVPNGDFEELYKPRTMIAGQVADGAWSQGVGPDCPIDSGTYAFSDGTTGDVADIAGWVGYDRDGWLDIGIFPNGSYDRDQTTGNLQGSIGIAHNATEGGAMSYLSNGGDWENPAGGLIVSDAPLGNVENGTYTLSMVANGSATPVVLHLLAGGVELTPASSVNPPLTEEWQEFSRTYDSGSLAGHIGQPLTIALGVGRNATGTQSRFDDVKLFHSPGPLPTQMPRLPARRADLDDDKKIDFNDFAKLATWWLDDQLWP